MANANGWDGIKSKFKQLGQQAGKRFLLAQSAKALGTWLDRAGWTVESLDEALRTQQPILEQAWATIPMEVLQRLHDTIYPIAATLTPEDYPIVLQELAAYPQWQAYADLLYYYHYDAFAHAVSQLRQWFLAGGGGQGIGGGQDMSGG